MQSYVGNTFSSKYVGRSWEQPSQGLQPCIAHGLHYWLGHTVSEHYRMWLDVSLYLCRSMTHLESRSGLSDGGLWGTMGNRSRSGMAKALAVQDIWFISLKRLAAQLRRSLLSKTRGRAHESLVWNRDKEPPMRVQTEFALCEFERFMNKSIPKQNSYNLNAIHSLTWN